MPRQRTDPDRLADGDAFQRVEPADVDQFARRRQPQLQRRDQRVAAGDELVAVEVVLQQRDGLLERGRANVVERGGDHCGAPARAC
jgi:hypothetical protein